MYSFTTLDPTVSSLSSRGLMRAFQLCPHMKKVEEEEAKPTHEAIFSFIHEAIYGDRALVTYTPPSTVALD